MAEKLSKIDLFLQELKEGADKKWRKAKEEKRKETERIRQQRARRDNEDQNLFSSAERTLKMLVDENPHFRQWIENIINSGSFPYFLKVIVEPGSNVQYYLCLKDERKIVLLKGENEIALSNADGDVARKVRSVLKTLRNEREWATLLFKRYGHLFVTK